MTPLPLVRRVTRRPAAIVGGTLLTAIVCLAIFGPFFAPHSPTAPIGAPFSGSMPGAPLGTDYLGRDVLSRVLDGGRSVLILAGLITGFAYLVGLTVGLVVGMSRTIIDPLLMRAVDVLLSFPGLILLLLIITALGTGKVPLVIGATIIQIPSIARIMRTAALQQSVRGFVEAAVARGERFVTILVREILPNIGGTIAADIGLRLTYSILIVASVNFLGLGVQPPAADWGLMVAENRPGFALNPLSVLVPAVLIALLTISLNLVADAVVRRRERT